jgi:hypothetical protein
MILAVTGLLVVGVVVAAAVALLAFLLARDDADRVEEEREKHGL